SGSIAAIGALLVSYVRPEYFVSFIVFSLLLLFLVAHNLLRRKNTFTSLWPAMMGFLLAVPLLVFVGLPIGNRSMVAFGQHFSVNWVSWHKHMIDLGPGSMYPWTNWQDIVSRSFGNVNSVQEAFLANPTIFLVHVFYNLLRLAKIVPNLLMPQFSQNALEYTTLIGFVSYILILSRKRNRQTSLYQNLHQYKTILLTTAIFMIPGIISIAIIYPRDHYLLILVTLTIIGVITILFADSSNQRERDNYKTLSAILAISATLLFLFRPYQEPTIRSNIETIRLIQSLNISRPVNMLEAHGGYDVYLGRNFNRVAEYSKGTNFHEFRLRNNINMILVSNPLISDTRFVSDREWLDFLENHEEFGYVRREVPGTAWYLLIHTSLISE
uniref:hypothetical protein n=1 Tax=uncultured Chloroflexus sp. TaxID=214040 RepID=UPI0026278C12